jgi:hypothetical protein
VSTLAKLRELVHYVPNEIKISDCEYPFQTYFEN